VFICASVCIFMCLVGACVRVRVRVHGFVCMCICDCVRTLTIRECVRTSVCERVHILLCVYCSLSCPSPQMSVFHFCPGRV